MDNEQLTKYDIETKTVEMLRTVFDPEIPVNVYDLGLIYKIDIDDEFNVKILMTMTAPDCPEAEYMFREVKEMVGYIQGIKSVDVELTFDPPWSFENLSDATKAELGFL